MAIALLLAGWGRDLRLGARALARRPTTTLIAVVTLALGIGAATAVFSLVEGILLRPLPYPRAGGLYLVRESVRLGRHDYPDLAAAAGNLLAWQRETGAFASLALLEPATANLDQGGEATQVHGARVSASLLPMLGVTPLGGRNFLPREEAAGRDREILLSYGLWRSGFGGDPSIVGKRVELGGYGYTVVGLLPPTFYFPRPSYLYTTPIAGWDAPVQYLVPLGLRDYERQSGIGHFNFIALARLRSGVTAGAAISQVNAIEASIARRDGHGARLWAALVPLGAALVGPYAASLWMLLAAALLLLAAVAASVGGLVLAWRLGESHGWAVRAALGASTRDLLRAAASEAGLLALAGWVIGVAGAAVALGALVGAAAWVLPRLAAVRLDGRVLLFALALTLAAGLLSLLPAWQLRRLAPAEALKAASPQAVASTRQRRLRGGLVVGEVALATVLVALALSLGQSLRQVLDANAWMRTDRVLTLELVMPPDHYSRLARRQELLAALAAKIQAMPGVAAAGFTSALPLRGQRWVDLLSFAERPEPEGRRPAANFRAVTPGYFAALGLPLERGRYLAASDRGQAVAVVSAGVARAVLAGHDPLGLHVAWNSPAAGKVVPLRVIGVVGDARVQAAAPAPLTVYVPAWLFAGNEMWLVVRAGGAPAAVAAGLRAAVRRQDPLIAMPREETLGAVVNEEVAPRRFVLDLGGLFALFTAFLAALGLYGAIAVSVRQRRREIAMRLALGAARGAVLRRELGRGLGMAALGLAIGLGLYYAALRGLTSSFSNLAPASPFAFLATAAILLAVAAAATALPAWRAARLDPMAVLREA